LRAGIEHTTLNMSQTNTITKATNPIAAHSPKEEPFLPPCGLYGFKSWNKEQVRDHQRYHIDK
jgi:hypothetical protein